ncbi:MAG: beta-galactosidase, partial [Lentisphaeria bacterium]|nr:beta-galactosidase [Lentisphaeria bacterium]
FVSAMVAEQFTRSGVDSQYGGKWTAQSGPYANQWWLPYATRFIDDKTDWYQLKRTREQDDLARSPCLTDPAYRKKVRESLLRTAHAALAVGTGDITLGDENHFVAGRWDLCFSDTCVPDFRLWAQKNYGTLDALNASWGAKFADWAQVRPKTYDACKADGNFVPWIDHRLHMESVWADIHAFSRDVIREVIPDARVGYEGSDTHIGTWRAADFWKLSRAMNLNNIYYRDFISQAWADFVEPGTLLGAGWFGGYAGNRNDVYMHYFPWRAIFKGGNSLWVWAGYGHAGAVMSFDTSLYPFFQTACDEVAELKRGAGKLLITSERCHDGVALLYSAASVHVAETIPGAPKPEDVLNSWVRILNDLGIASRIVSYEQLAKGRVKAAPNGFRALILPCAWAMSPVECAAVQAFADDGGAVLADLMPALTDEHGKAFDELPLAPLFGAKRTGAFAEKTDILHGVEGISDASVEGIGIRKDNALLLNLSLDGYARLPKPKETDFAGWVEGAAYRKLVADALAAAGVVPAVTLAPIQPRVEISRFRRGDCEYIALLQALPRDPIEYTLKTAQPPQANIVTIQFPRKAYLYDVRAGKYLGRKDRLETELTPGIAKLYALLPGKVSRMRVDAPRRARVGDSVSVKLTVVAKGAKADRVLHVEVIGPDGIARAPYARTLLANGGNAEIHIHFALSDPPGKWRVTARDAATGVADTDTIRLVQ